MYTAGRVDSQHGSGSFCMASPPLLAIDDDVDDVECEEDHCRDVTSAQAECGHSENLME